MRLAVGVLLGLALGGSAASAQDRPLLPDGPLVRPDTLFPVPGGPLAGAGEAGAPCGTAQRSAAGNPSDRALTERRAAPRGTAGAEAGGGDARQGARTKRPAWGERPLSAETNRPLWDSSGASAPGKREKRPGESDTPAKARPGEPSLSDRERPLWGDNEPDADAADPCTDAAGPDRPLWDTSRDSLMGRPARP